MTRVEGRGTGSVGSREPPPSHAGRMLSGSSRKVSEAPWTITRLPVHVQRLSALPHSILRHQVVEKGTFINAFFSPSIPVKRRNMKEEKAPLRVPSPRPATQCITSLYSPSSDGGERHLHKHNMKIIEIVKTVAINLLTSIEPS
ncbi:hypothetical protein E2C01_046988 [Portunus trituberculatus]|uniref:Uncharacterized protein n=1 Tax=Portunus trituberculatus TaxID=210409 RepID=A0A5B7G769_PORTR|nr:hypothetical protein [Portunus trituberculatus]